MKQKTHKINLSDFINTTHKINKAKNFITISEIIFAFIKKLFHYDLAVFYRVNEITNQLEVVSCRGTNIGKLKERSRFNIGEGSVGWVAKMQKALLIEDVLNYEDEDIKVRLHDEDPQIRSFLVVPLIVENKTIGVLSVSCSKPSSYNATDVEMITILASQAAVLLELNKKFSTVERFSNQVLENINSAVVAVDKQKKIVVFNKKAVDTTGYSSEEMVNKSIKSLKIWKKSDNKNSVECFIDSEVLFEEPGWIITSTGEAISVILSTSILYDDDGNYNGNIIIFRDNTMVEQLQKQVIQSEKLAVAGRMTAGILHEIRNPLLPIRSSAQMLLSKSEKEGFNEDYTRLIRIIYEESERLNGFLKTLEGFGKTGKQNLGGPLFSTLSDIMLICKQNFEKNTITTSIESDINNEVYIPFSKDQFKQILLNLLLNAIDAINEKNESDDRHIKIEILNFMNQIKMRIIDTGIGVKEKEINTILDPFFTTKEHGTGLGLSIISHLITSQNGMIDIKNNRNKGTCVELTIPVVKEGEKYE